MAAACDGSSELVGFSEDAAFGVAGSTGFSSEVEVFCLFLARRRKRKNAPAPRSRRQTPTPIPTPAPIATLFELLFALAEGVLVMEDVATAVGVEEPVDALAVVEVAAGIEEEEVVSAGSELRVVLSDVDTTVELGLG